MAGDWIKMRGNLWDDPRISRICDLTDQPEAMVVGGLYWLWSSADQHTEDGIMPGLTLRGIDRKTGIQGLGDALVAVGWLADHPEGVRIVNVHKGDFLFIVGYDRLRPGATEWYALRERVFQRDNWTCVYCGTSTGTMECDHIHPVALGGSHHLDNLATACFKCNRSKGAKTLNQWRQN